MGGAQLPIEQAILRGHRGELERVNGIRGRINQAIQWEWTVDGTTWRSKCRWVLGEKGSWLRRGSRFIIAGVPKGASKAVEESRGSTWLGHQRVTGVRHRFQQDCREWSRKVVIRAAEQQSHLLAPLPNPPKAEGITNDQHAKRVWPAEARCHGRIHLSSYLKGQEEVTPRCEQKIFGSILVATCHAKRSSGMIVDQTGN